MNRWKFWRGILTSLFLAQPGSSEPRVLPELEAILVKRILAQLDDREFREQCIEVVTSSFPSLWDGSLGFTPRGLMFLP